MESVKLSVILSLVLSVFSYTSMAQQAFEPSSYYACMATDDINCVNAQLDIVEASADQHKDAYAGTLLMKKAGLVKGASNKLSTFRAGHKRLEGAIAKDNSNAELHFLRLMIQEHAPAILGYNGDLQKDSDFIKKSYPGLSAVVQQAIANYSKKSKILKPSDFNSHQG